MSVIVRTHDIDITTPAEVKLKSPSLTAALIHSKEDGNPDDIVNLFKFVDNSFSLDDVSVDASGAVIIKSQKLQDAVRSTIQNISPTEAMLANGICGAGCPTM